ncbi:MAG: nucleotidyl transferase AbiEii/AbiGii toxin family protein [Actinomycetota bacterium]
MTDHGYEQNQQMVHMVFDCEPTSGAGLIRVKIEMNVREVQHVGEIIEIPYEVKSGWWEGSAGIQTFTPEELLSTKVRALYQRRKGRDLFDIWLALTSLDLNDERVMDCLRRYLGPEAFGYQDLVRNLRDKIARSGFRTDLDQLLVERPVDYGLDEAADLVMERLGARLPGAPPIREIEHGAWRQPP